MENIQVGSNKNLQNQFTKHKEVILQSTQKHDLILYHTDIAQHCADEDTKEI